MDKVKYKSQQNKQQQQKTPVPYSLKCYVLEWLTPPTFSLTVWLEDKLFKPWAVVHCRSDVMCADFYLHNNLHRSSNGLLSKVKFAAITLWLHLDWHAAVFPCLLKIIVRHALKGKSICPSCWKKQIIPLSKTTLTLMAAIPAAKRHIVWTSPPLTMWLFVKGFLISPSPFYRNRQYAPCTHNWHVHSAP